MIFNIIQNIIFGYRRETGYYIYEWEENDVKFRRCICYGNKEILCNFFLDVISLLKEPLGLSIRYRDNLDESEWFINREILLSDILNYFRNTNSSSIMDNSTILGIWSDFDKVEIVADDHEEISIIGFENLQGFQKMIEYYKLKKFLKPTHVQSLRAHFHLWRVNTHLIEELSEVFHLTKEEIKTI